jgi:dihydroorotase
VAVAVGNDQVAALADKVRRASNRMYCDFAFYIGGTKENVADLAAFEKLPGCAGIKVFMGSSTGELLVEDDEGVARILAQTNRRAAFKAGAGSSQRTNST